MELLLHHLKQRAPDENTQDISTEASEDGTCKVTYVPAIVGTWTAKACWTGDDLTEGATAPEMTFEVVNTPLSTSRIIGIPNEYSIIGIVSIVVITMVGNYYSRREKSREKTSNAKAVSRYVTV